ncbi:unnamed protein product [Porites lobata]|uniref:Uncharacterized protein n=1 Tax=Porites lobata TaxID=104759 RepID=A0ABN8PG46_9CNID|nr:unnamed protein product [Porites lobata]
MKGSTCLMIYSFTMHSQPICSINPPPPCLDNQLWIITNEAFPSNARVPTFLSTISRCQASVHHVAGATILPSDFASGNARKCDNSTCQVCSFIQLTKDSVVLCASVQSILVGKAKLHFTRKS